MKKAKMKRKGTVIKFYSNPNIYVIEISIRCDQQLVLLCFLRGAKSRTTIWSSSLVEKFCAPYFNSKRSEKLFVNDLFRNIQNLRFWQTLYVPSSKFRWRTCKFALQDALPIRFAAIAIYSPESIGSALFISKLQQPKLFSEKDNQHNNNCKTCCKAICNQ